MLMTSFMLAVWGTVAAWRFMTSASSKPESVSFAAWAKAPAAFPDMSTSLSAAACCSLPVVCCTPAAVAAVCSAAFAACFLSRTKVTIMIAAITAKSTTT